MPGLIPGRRFQPAFYGFSRPPVAERLSPGPLNGAKAGSVQRPSCTAAVGWFIDPGREAAENV